MQIANPCENLHGAGFWGKCQSSHSVLRRARPGLLPTFPEARWQVLSKAELPSSGFGRWEKQGLGPGTPRLFPPTWTWRSPNVKPRLTDTERQSLCLCGSQQTVENSLRDGNTRPPDLPLEKPVCRSRNNSKTGHGTTDRLQIRKGVRQGCILSIKWYCQLNNISYLTYKQNTSCEMPGWMKHKLESRLPGEISITSDVQMTPPLWQKAKN